MADKRKLLLAVQQYMAESENQFKGLQIIAIPTQQTEDGKINELGHHESTCDCDHHFHVPGANSGDLPKTSAALLSKIDKETTQANKTLLQVNNNVCQVDRNMKAQLNIVMEQMDTLKEHMAALATRSIREDFASLAHNQQVLLSAVAKVDSEMKIMTESIKTISERLQLLMPADVDVKAENDYPLRW